MGHHQRKTHWIIGGVAALLLTGANAAHAQIYTSIAQISGAIDPDATMEELEEDAKASTEFADPWEGFNRKMFAAHLFIDDAVFVPAAKGYRAVTPKSGRRGIRRFFSNWRTPGVLVNDILQGRVQARG